MMSVVEESDSGFQLADVPSSTVYLDEIRDVCQTPGGCCHADGINAANAAFGLTPASVPLTNTLVDGIELGVLDPVAPSVPLRLRNFTIKNRLPTNELSDPLSEAQKKFNFKK